MTKQSLSAYYGSNENAPLLRQNNKSPQVGQDSSKCWFPEAYEPDVHRTPRSMRRRFFLLLTEPDTSISSFIVFVILIVIIFVMNLVMMLQTVSAFQFTPPDCRHCGGKNSYLFDDDDDSILTARNSSCTCPPAPLPWTVTFLNFSVIGLAIEWTLRVVFFAPPAWASSTFGQLTQWWDFLSSSSTILDALAIFPYYVELTFQTNGLMSLRLLRLFRVFQLVRLGQYHTTFTSLTSVMVESFLYLKLLLGVLVFGAAFFGSMLYWLEKGEWRYWEETGDYRFVRVDARGHAEISPFTSIPSTFWWFIVTATTVGYGDEVPVTPAGKFLGILAMLTGVLVIAFPVSVFSELWSRQLKKAGAIQDLEEGEDTEEPALQVPEGSTRSLADSLPENAEAIVMHPNDWNDLISQYHSIQESQQQIRTILRKYHHHKRRIVADP